MHQIQGYCLVRHGRGHAFFEQYLQQIAETQGLIASATSEVGIGGDLRPRLCAVEREGDSFRLAKRCSAISYCAHAASILVTARRAPDAGASDQVLVLLRRSDCELSIGAE